jgi:hypothetical protein
VAKNNGEKMSFKDFKEQKSSDVSAKDTFTNIFSVCEYLLFEKPAQLFKLGLQKEIRRQTEALGDP